MNCKPGDLAIQIRSTCGNEGRIVEVLSFLGERPEYDGVRWAGRLGPSWLCRYVGGPVKINKGRLFTECPIPDAWLRPISGVPVHDEVTDEVPA